MDLDDSTAAQHPSRKPSILHDRPSRAPFGPRIRARPKHSLDAGLPTTDPLFLSSLSRPASPSAESTTFSIDASLASPPFPAFFDSPPHADVAVQAPSTPPLSPSPPLPDPTRSSSPLPLVSTPTPPKSAPTTFIAPPPLTPPPTIMFEPTPIPWKGLPLEVAQWTFSSSELQEIVSRAIRLSARESFVRILSLQALEVDIVQELERLDAERATAQAKWRFEVGRRTMLMQALNAIPASTSVPSGNTTGTDSADGTNPILSFVGQLASSIATCDTLLSSILCSSDQKSQIEVIQHQHWASALGIALRKLNRAHERQAHELACAQIRVQTLEDELEEAWREAERMAIEFDVLEQGAAASDTEDDSQGLDMGLAPVQDTGVTIDVDTTTRVSSTTQDVDETGTLGDAAAHTGIAVVLGVTATAVASKATLFTSTGNSSPRDTTIADRDKTDSKSIRSTRSRRSKRESHLARLSAARLRSRTASNASLRLPKSLRSPSSSTLPSHSSHVIVVDVDAPPIPALPQPSNPGHSFLDMDHIASPRKAFPPQRHPEPTIALPTPPHSAGLPPTRVPSVWLDAEDGGDGQGSSTGGGVANNRRTRLNGQDRTHSLQIFSSLSPIKPRRSNLVMSLTNEDRISESGVGRSGEADGTGGDVDDSSESAEDSGPSPSRRAMELGREIGLGTGEGSGVGEASLSTSDDRSIMSLAAHVRGPSLVSSTGGMGKSMGRNKGVGTRVGLGIGIRPGSAGARLTTTTTTTTTTGTNGTATTTSSRDTLAPMPTMLTPMKRSLVSRASSVILRRLSQATTTMGHHKGSARGGGSGGGKGSRAGSGARMGGLSSSPTSSRSRSHEALNSIRSGTGSGRGWRKGRGSDVDGDDEGEVMVIGSLRSASVSLDDV